MHREGMAMDDFGPLRARLDAIDEQISAARARLNMKGLFHKNHEATTDELSQRYQMLSAKLDSEVASLAADGKDVDSFEKTALIWLNGLGFDR